MATSPDQMAQQIGSMCKLLSAELMGHDHGQSSEHRIEDAERLSSLAGLTSRPVLSVLKSGQAGRGETK